MQQRLAWAMSTVFPEVMRVLVTGATGQVGRALRSALPAGIDATFTTRADLDVGDQACVHDYVSALKPDWIINAAAYTAVDKAESNEASAVQLNALAPRYLADAAKNITRARVIQISTDFVFDGRKNLPYRPDDFVAPLGVYGRSKADGESAVLNVLGDRGLVVRTAWVYDAQGQNFVRTMLRLLNERGAVSVVSDQIGTPTSAASLARVLWLFVQHPEVSGVFHWTDAGVASWYDFAVAIAEEGMEAGLIKRDVKVTPIVTAGYPTPAQRPAYSVMDKQSTIEALGIEPVHWRKNLRIVMREIAHA